MVTLSPRFLSSRPNDAAVIPLPSEETTPPVTKIYLVTLSETSRCLLMRHSQLALPETDFPLQSGEKIKKVTPNKWGHFS